ncbi:hypothetical protein ACFV1B_11115 [Streptomyces sp. NPDC059637]|uniref:hypothetical protein n=1 Tax=Streptomyces sp. NPDC059637 TaxID=3347752 RepID=UPI00368A98F9
MTSAKKDLRAVGETVAAEAAFRCTAEEFKALLEDLVEDTAPRLFALVEEEGDRADGWVLGWGMAFEDRATVLRADGRAVHHHRSAESAHRFFSRFGKVHLMWCPPAPAGPCA